MSNTVEWAPLDEEAIAKDEEDFGGGGGGEFYKLDEGTHRLRFLPRLKHMKTHARRIHEHFVEGKGGSKVNFACPRRMSMGQQSCPICDEADRLKNSRNPVDKKAAKDLYPRHRVYANVIVRGREAEGPKLVAMSPSVFKDIGKIQEDAGDYTNPTETGFDIIIKREGTGKNDTRYTVNADRKDSALAEDEDEMLALIAGQWDLDEKATPPAMDELIEMLGLERRSSRSVGGGRSRGSLSSGDVDDDSGSRRRRRRPATTMQDEVENGTTIDVDANPVDDDDDVPI